MRASGAWLLALSLSCVTATAEAQLEAAEAAYVDVDFETTLSASQTAIDSGELDPTELARAYELLGVSAVALGDAAAARDCFLRMLSIDPAHHLDDTVPPRFRAPYLEARGRITRDMSADVTLARVNGSLRVGLVDPYEMVERIRLHMRAQGEVAYTTFEAAYAEEILAPFAPASGSSAIEYWLELIDPRGNQVLVQGTEFAPNVLGATTVVSGGETPPPTSGRSILEEPVFWIIVGSVVAVGAGIGIGIGIDQSSHVNFQTSITF